MPPRIIGGSSRGREDVIDDIEVPLVNLGSRRERRQARKNPNVPNDETTPTSAPTATPVPEMATAFVMITQVVQGQQAMLQEQMRMQTERQPEIGSHTHFEMLKKTHMPTFDGNSDPEQVEKWISELEGNFEVLEILELVKVM